MNYLKHAILYAISIHKDRNISQFMNTDDEML